MIRFLVLLAGLLIIQIALVYPALADILDEFKEEDYIITQILVEGQPVFAGSQCYILRPKDDEEYGVASEGKEILRWRLHPRDKIQISNPEAEIILKRGAQYISLKMSHEEETLFWKIPAVDKTTKQRKGKIYYNYTEKLKEKAKIVFGPQTNLVELSVEGTSFEIADAGQDFTLLVISGVVSLKHKNGEIVRLKPGEGMKGDHQSGNWEKTALEPTTWETLKKKGEVLTRKTEEVYTNEIAFKTGNTLEVHSYREKIEITDKTLSKAFTSEAEAREYLKTFRADVIDLQTGLDYWKAAGTLANMGKNTLKKAESFL
ncbi:hypothetical protein KJ966_20800 [bacterium]|nr:hypothetical protein [bacterium]